MTKQRAVATGATATGAITVGTLAVGALAIGTIAVGSLVAEGWSREDRRSVARASQNFVSGAW